MPTYVAFLRAINVGKRKYPMAELRAALTAAGFTDVETHIQTGNVRLTTPMRAPTKVERALEKVFTQDRGFDVAAVVRTPAELAALGEELDLVAGDKPPQHGHYVSLLRDEPSAQDATVMESKATAQERVVVRGRHVHLLYDRPYHEAKTSNATVERVIGVATNRNAKVIRALADKWGAP